MIGSLRITFSCFIYMRNISIDKVSVNNSSFCTVRRMRDETDFFKEENS